MVGYIPAIDSISYNMSETLSEPLIHFFEEEHHG